MSKTSSIERVLTEHHGNLHEVIPSLASRVGQEETARTLGVRQAWVSRWLRTHGYVQVVQYVRNESEAVSHVG
jgi:hypothetical protein